MDQHGVQKRQQAVDVIQWRAAVASLEPEAVLLAGDEVVENAEITAGSFTFKASYGIQFLRGIQSPQSTTERRHGAFDVRLRNLVAMVPQRALQNCTAVGDLPDQNGLCHGRGKFRRIRPPILLTSQQDVT